MGATFANPRDHYTDYINFLSVYMVVFDGDADVTTYQVMPRPPTTRSMVRKVYRHARKEARDYCEMLDYQEIYAPTSKT